MKGNEEDQNISSIPFSGKLAQMAGVEIYITERNFFVHTLDFAR